MKNFKWTRMTTLLIVLFTLSIEAVTQNVTWKCTTPQKSWTDLSSLPVSAWDNDTSEYVNVNAVKKFQQIDGWGGCFNERGWDAMANLSEKDRNSIIQAFFDQENGCKLNYGRTPIGCSDYSTNWYSYDETPGDYEMKNFSIARDKQKLIPFMKAALVYCPDMKIWAVPWTSPNWVKDKKDIFLSDPNIQSAYALYFYKYVKAYKTEGINIFMVMPENEEPNIHAAGNPINPFWTHFTTDSEYDFVKNYLIPRFRNDGLNCEIWLGTLHMNQFDFVEKCLSDSSMASYIKGAGFQWEGDEAMHETHKHYPDKKLMQTETKCNIDLEPLRQVNTNDWAYAVEQWGLIKRYLDSWANSYMLWNLVLDETGYSITNWSQNSPVVVNRKTKQITYNPQFYAFKHFSYFIKPGAHRIETTGNYNDQIAFIDAKGDIVLEIQNSHSIEHSVAINFNGKKIKPILPARSWNTFTIRMSEERL